MKQKIKDAITILFYTGLTVATLLVTWECISYYAPEKGIGYASCMIAWFFTFYAGLQMGSVFDKLEKFTENYKNKDKRVCKLNEAINNFFNLKKEKSD